MDKQRLKEFLASVAEIKELKPKTSPTIRLDETDQNDVRLPNGEWIHINKETNPTLGYEFVKLKEQNRACELNCGNIVPNQVIERRLNYHPKKHWKTKCVTCGKFVKPDGVGFDLNGTASQQSYIKHFAQKSRKQGEPAANYTEDGREYEEIVTKDSIIRKYK